MAGAHGDRQGVDAGALDEVDRLVGIGEQLVHAQLALGAVAVLLLAAAVLERAEAAELALDADAEGMRDVDHLAGDGDVVLVAGRGLAVLLERAVHHHRGEAVADGADAGVGGVAVVLVHHHRDLGVELDRGFHELGQEDVVGVLARAAAGLDDHRRLGRARRLHDRLDLLHVVDIQGAHAVAVGGGVVEERAQGDEGHGCPGSGLSGYGEPGTELSLPAGAVKADSCTACATGLRAAALAESMLSSGAGQSLLHRPALAARAAGCRRRRLRPVRRSRSRRGRRGGSRP